MIKMIATTAPTTVWIGMMCNAFQLPTGSCKMHVAKDGHLSATVGQ
jgi:hypothetical protein